MKKKAVNQREILLKRAERTAARQRGLLEIRRTWDNTIPWSEIKGGYLYYSDHNCSLRLHKVVTRRGKILTVQDAVGRKYTVRATQALGWYKRRSAHMFMVKVFE